VVREKIRWKGVWGGSVEEDCKMEESGGGKEVGGRKGRRRRREGKGCGRKAGVEKGEGEGREGGGGREGMRVRKDGGGRWWRGKGRGEFYGSSVTGGSDQRLGIKEGMC